MDSSRTNPLLATAALDSLASAFTAYDALAEATARRLLSGETGTDLGTAISGMQARYVDLVGRLSARTARDRAAMTSGFTDRISARVALVREITTSVWHF